MPTKIFQKQFMSDIICEDYKSWKKGEVVILDGGTGKGKTTFCLKKLAKHASDELETVLYLCNRSKLKSKVEQDVKKLRLQDTVTVKTYQDIENKLNNGKCLDNYDYIISDECHYFTTDSMFNAYTDLSYDYLMNQKSATVIFLSATAKLFFIYLIGTGKVQKDRAYELPNDYEYVKHLYSYKKNDLIPLIKDILKSEEDSKIVLFVQSGHRMIELNSVFKKRADYYCSESTKNPHLNDIRTDDCIHKSDGLVTFNKRLLITTSALDNGIDLKDRKIKYIFSELSDMDVLIQSLGRKRPLDNDDTCDWYVLDRGRNVQSQINNIEHLTNLVTQFKKDNANFCSEHGRELQDITRNNNVFYIDNNSHLSINKMAYIKQKMNKSMYKKILKDGFMPTLVSNLGSDMAQKTEQISCESNYFLDILKSFENRNLYHEDQDEIKKLFESIGVKLRYKGINTFNGILNDKCPKYPLRFHNTDSIGKRLIDKKRKLDDGSENPHRNKCYWILSEAS